MKITFRKPRRAASPTSQAQHHSTRPCDWRSVPTSGTISANVVNVSSTSTRNSSSHSYMCFGSCPMTTGGVQPMVCLSWQQRGPKKRLRQDAIVALCFTHHSGTGSTQMQSCYSNADKHARGGGGHAFSLMLKPLEVVCIMQTTCSEVNVFMLGLSQKRRELIFVFWKS